MLRANKAAVAVIALVLVAVALGASCSSSSDTSSSGPANESTKDVAADISRQLTASKFLDKQAADCVGDRVAPRISQAGKSLSKSVQAITGLSKSDQNLIYTALNKCVSAAQFADIIATGTAGAITGVTTAAGAPTTTSPITTCLAEKLTQKYPTSGEMFQALFGKQNEAEILSMLTSCGIPGISPPSSAG
jgi:hypothetical protein